MLEEKVRVSSLSHHHCIIKEHCAILKGRIADIFKWILKFLKKKSLDGLFFLSHFAVIDERLLAFIWKTYISVKLTMVSIERLDWKVADRKLH